MLFCLFARRLGYTWNYFWALNLKLNQKILLLNLCDKDKPIHRGILISHINSFLNGFNKEKDDEKKVPLFNSDLLRGASAGINNRKEAKTKELLFSIDDKENTYSINLTYKKKIIKILNDWGLD